MQFCRQLTALVRSHRTPELSGARLARLRPPPEALRERFYGTTTNSDRNNHCGRRSLWFQRFDRWERDLVRRFTRAWRSRRKVSPKAPCREGSGRDVASRGASANCAAQAAVCGRLTGPCGEAWRRGGRLRGPLLAPSSSSLTSHRDREAMSPGAMHVVRTAWRPEGS